MDVMTEWAVLMDAVDDAESTDGSPVGTFCRLAVRRLLLDHRPSPDDSHSTGFMCLECWQTWPCDVYLVIEKKESHHGE